MPGRSSTLHPFHIEEGFFDTLSAEDEALPCGSPSSSTSVSASVSFPPVHNYFDEKQIKGTSTQRDGLFCDMNDADRDISRVLTTSDSSPKSPQWMKARKLKAFEKSPLSGVMQNACSVSNRNVLVSMKGSASNSQFRGFKQQQVLQKKACQANTEVANNPEVSLEPMLCVNDDLQSDCSVNAPTSLQGVNALESNDESNCSTCNPTELDRKESDLGYDAVAVKHGHACTHLLAWFAGIVFRAFRSQWDFFFHLLFSLMLAWYRAFLFALNPLSYIMHVRAKAREAHRGKKSDTVKSGLRSHSRALVMRPTLAKGARKLTFGCLTALYSTSMLSGLFIASFTLSFFVIRGFVHEPVQLYQYLFFDYTQQFPVALINFSASVMHSDTGSVLKRLAYPTRIFHATVYLTVPESDFNKKLGIFQVTAEFISATGQVLLSKTQPCMLRFRSNTLQHIKAFFMAVPLLAGSYWETQTLAVSSLRWQEQRPLSFAAVRVVLAPRAGRPLHTGLPELYEAGVRLESELPLWARIIGNWRWTLSVWLGLALFIGAVIIILGLCNQFLLPDLGLLCSVVSEALRQRRNHKLKAAYHKHEKLGAEPALDTDISELVNG